MTTKKKILLILAALFVGFLLIILLTILTSLDISTEELGPSPFKIKAELALDQNQEFHELVIIGESIKGIEEFENNYAYSTNDLEISIALLQKYLEQNDSIIEKAPLDLFKKCNLPKPKSSINPNLSSLVNLLRLINRRATFHILTKNFDKAKENLIFINEINNELIKKPAHHYFGLNIMYSIEMEIENIKLLINQPYFSLEQKLEILGIEHKPISSEFLINHLYFDTIIFQENINAFRSSNIIKPDRLKTYPKTPLLTTYLFKPNKSTRYYRKKALEIISLLENPSVPSMTELKKRSNLNMDFLQLIRANSFGKIYANESIHLLKNMSLRLFTINNTYHQFYVAQQILLYKQKFKQLPPDLIMLNLDSKKSIDIHSGTTFFYYAPNGILFGFPKYGKVYIQKLIDQELSDEEILNLIKKYHDEREFIMYLK